MSRVRPSLQSRARREPPQVLVDDTWQPITFVKPHRCERCGGMTDASPCHRCGHRAAAERAQ